MDQPGILCKKNPSLTTLEVPWENPSAIALQSLLIIQNVSRRIFGSKLTDLKASQILFHLKESSKSESRSWFGLINRDSDNKSMDTQPPPLSESEMGESCNSASWVTEV